MRTEAEAGNERGMETRAEVRERVDAVAGTEVEGKAGTGVETWARGKGWA